MSRSVWPVIGAWVVAWSTVIGAQVSQVLRTPPRDAVPPGSIENRIPIGTSSIGGTVTTETGRPVPGALVTVSGRTADIMAGLERMWLSRTVVTGASGEFAFPRLPAGRFMLSASTFQDQLPGVNYGQRRPGGRGQSISLADGQSVTLTVPMPRGAVITGIVIGPDGEPQENVQVRALRYDMSTGLKRLQAVRYVHTDDRGVYRIFGLEPGHYIVAAAACPTGWQQLPGWRYGDLVERAILSAPVMPRATAVAWAKMPDPGLDTDGSPPMYLPTYAPGAIAPSEATVVALAASEERAGVDIQIRLIAASTIHGTVSTPLDAGVAVQLWLQNDDPAADTTQGNYQRVNQDGGFTFNAVAPGTYTVFAQTVATQTTRASTENGVVVETRTAPVLTEAQQMWGQARVTVNGQSVVPVSVALQPARSISGIVVFDMKAPPDLTRHTLEAYLEAAPSPQGARLWNGHRPALVRPDGRFTITGVPPGRYVLRFTSGLLKSAVVSGQDTIDFGFDFAGERDVTDAVLTMTDRCTELSGTLLDATGRPESNYMLIVAPTDSRYWTPGSRRIQLIEPDFDGRYSVQGLPAGSYQLSVVFDVEPGAQYDPDFLRAVARASVPVIIGDGAVVTQNLRVK